MTRTMKLFEMSLFDEGHDAMAEDKVEVIARALRDVSDKIRTQQYEDGYFQNVRDVNGNIIGQWRLKL